MKTPRAGFGETGILIMNRFEYSHPIGFIVYLLICLKY